MYFYFLHTAKTHHATTPCNISHGMDRDIRWWNLVHTASMDMKLKGFATSKLFRVVGQRRPRLSAPSPTISSSVARCGSLSVDCTTAPAQAIQYSYVPYAVREKECLTSLCLTWLSRVMWGWFNASCGVSFEECGLLWASASRTFKESGPYEEGKVNTICSRRNREVLSAL